MNNFCSNCGTALSGESPKTCSSCFKTHYENPVPVAVAVVPVLEDGKTVGALGVLRSNKTGVGSGKWGFPGGFLDINENVAEGAARELWEETGIRVDPKEGVALDTRISSNGLNILIFIQFPAVSMDDVHQASPDLKEVDRVDVITSDTDFAFSTHRDIFHAVIEETHTPRTLITRRHR